ncbi:MAG: hypothetical protein ACREK6_18605 [Candidatus Rokuibacteriota bacterium]
MVFALWFVGKRLWPVGKKFGYSTPQDLYGDLYQSEFLRRPERSSGNTLAEGWSEPFLQKAALSMLRTAAANHTRPFLSNMPLWLLARWLQIFASPQ